MSFGTYGQYRDGTTLWKMNQQRQTLGKKGGKKHIQKVCVTTDVKEPNAKAQAMARVVDTNKGE
jgi:hypothetical protein